MQKQPNDMSGVNAHPTAAPCPLGSVLGVVGGGQLGRMFAHAAQAMGFGVAVLDPQADAPAAQVTQRHIAADYGDAAALRTLAASAAAITTEFENVPAAALQTLADAGRTVRPAAAAVAIAQDRAAEKAHFVRCGAPCAPHAVLHSAQDVQAIVNNQAEQQRLLPGILKTARMGYDGKGQVRVRTAQDLLAAWQQLGGVTCVLEKMLPLAAECSLIIARGADGAIVHLPVQHNVHREGILAVTQVFEGNVPAATAAAALQAASRIAQALDYVGVLCVEFFVLDDGSLVVNEMAPRPHNSGHYSQNACDVSQFELQVRCLAGLPLVQPRQHSAAIMLNLLGDLWFDDQGRQREPDWDHILALPGAHLHLYGKNTPRPARKMGHLNITAPTPEAAYASALRAAAILGIEPFECAGAGHLCA